MAEPPDRELLRLRGEVGVLRRQIKEFQSQAMPERVPDEGAMLTDETLQKAELLLKSSEDEYERAKVLSDRLHENSQNEESMLQVVLTSGVEDNLLQFLVGDRAVKQRELVLMQQDSSMPQQQLEEWTNALSDLNLKITMRLQGFTSGVDVRADSLKQGIEDLRRELETAKVKGHPAKSF